MSDKEDNLLAEALEDLALVIKKNQQLQDENVQLRKQLIQEVIKHEQEKKK